MVFALRHCLAVKLHRYSTAVGVYQYQSEILVPALADTLIPAMHTIAAHADITAADIFAFFIVLYLLS